MHFLNGLLRAVTRIELDQNSGVFLRDENADPRYVRAIRIWNFIEPCAVFGAMMAIIWISMLDPAVGWAKPSFAVLGAWCLIVSPFVHYPFEKKLFLTEAQQRLGVGFYFFECRGMGSPTRYYLSRNGEPPYIKKYLGTILGVTAFIDLLFICAFITFREDIAERFSDLIDGSPARAMALRIGFLVLLDLLLVFVLYPFMLRLDNFRQSVPYLAVFVIVILVLAFGGNLLFQMNEDSLRIKYEHNPYMGLRGAKAIDRLHALDLFGIGGQWSGYVFWGFLQELLFLGIFSAQLARAFDIARSKFQFALACLCSATLFGLVHVPNFWLGAVTFIGGLFGAAYSMQCRNLFAFALVHGLGGTMTNRLLPINFSVGPSQMPK